MAKKAQKHNQIYFESLTGFSRSVVKHCFWAVGCGGQLWEHLMPGISWSHLHAGKSGWKFCHVKATFANVQMTAQRFGSSHSQGPAQHCGAAMCSINLYHVLLSLHTITADPCQGVVAQDGAYASRLPVPDQKYIACSAELSILIPHSKLIWNTLGCTSASEDFLA